MRGFSRVNVMLRKFPSAPSVASTLRRRTGRPSLTGTPYKAVDRVACWLIVLSAVLVGIALFFLEGMAVIPWILVGGPVTVGVACLLARLVDRTWFSRSIAVFYLVIAAGVLVVALNR